MLLEVNCKLPPPNPILALLFDVRLPNAVDEPSDTRPPLISKDTEEPKLGNVLVPDNVKVPEPVLM